MGNFDKERPYCRKKINGLFKKKKTDLHLEAVNRGYGVALFVDCYTGKILNGGDRYDFEHIISSEEVFMKYRETHSN